ncbi:MAG: hypothetical protein WCA89_12635, partial [Terracidiphilus sp.]
MSLGRILWCLLLVSGVAIANYPAFAKNQPEFQPAKVISQNIGSYNGGAAAMPIGTMVVAVPITRRSDIVVLETANHRLTLSEQMTGRGPVILPVNETIPFYQDGNWFIV